MVYRPAVNPKLCFVLIPFHSPFLDYYEGIVKPAAEAAGLDALKADEIYGTGPIIQDIWGSIWSASIVVADVTGKNPNVNYELGICHTLGVPTILITQSLDDVPFDYRHRRCIKYETAKLHWEENLKAAITQTITKVLSGQDTEEELRWPYDTNLLKETKRVGSFAASEDATTRVISGARLVSSSAARAFGPHGIHVSLKLGTKEDLPYKSGLVIAQGTQSSDRLEMTGIVHMRQTAQEMYASVGDGTKLAVLLLQEMLEGGHDAVKSGHLLRDVIHGMDTAVEAATKRLALNTKTVSSEDLPNVALTAAGGDQQVPKVIVEALRKAGKDGLVYVETGASPRIELETQEGLYFDRGFLSAQFVTDEDRQEAVLSSCYILIYDHKISSMKQLLPVLEQVARSRKSLLVIAEDVEGEALQTLVVNKNKGSLLSIAVKAPGIADRRRASLQDVAILTGGTFVSHESGLALENLNVSQLGRAETVVVTRDSTRILGGAGSRDAVEARARGIRNEIANTSDDYYAAILRERLARLVGAVCVIRVGAVSPVAQIDLKYKFERALASCSAAIETGVVPGGGLALLNAKKHLGNITAEDPSKEVGIKVVSRALEIPIRQQIQNARRNVDEVVGKLDGLPVGPRGFNAQTREVEDLFEAGVLDPTKMNSNALQIAFSHARAILQTGAWATDESSTNEVPPAIGLGQ